MSWLRRVLSRWAPEHLPPVITPADHVDLVRATAEQIRLLTRAELAIQAAMAHADQAFVPPKWIERRKKPR